MSGVFKDTVVVAVGGNSIIRDEDHKTVEDQYESVAETCKHLADIVESGYRLVICHGNGPQVGFILRRSAIAYDAAGLHEVPLSSCVADTQGAIGFQIQQALEIELNKRSIVRQTATVVTRVVVDPQDPGFLNPTKPIGSFFSREKMEQMSESYPDWKFVEDAGRGFRRVVASPVPEKIVELDIISSLIENDHIVIACGGGGIPVVPVQGGFNAVDAVIDKDLASALLSEKIEAKRFIISTGVQHVCLNFGQENEKKLEHLGIEELKQYVQEGHFAAGSMLPKIEAAIDFIEKGGEEVIITAPEFLKDAVEHKTGTRVTRES
ncbi:MAG: carbamate kinase [bacterium]|nr:carbamate kinase [bacterium]